MHSLSMHGACDSHSCIVLLTSAEIVGIAFEEATVFKNRRHFQHPRFI